LGERGTFETSCPLFFCQLFFFNRQKKGANNLLTRKKLDCSTNRHKPAETGTNQHKPAQISTNRQKLADIFVRAQIF